MKSIKISSPSFTFDCLRSFKAFLIKLFISEFAETKPEGAVKQAATYWVNSDWILGQKPPIKPPDRKKRNIVWSQVASTNLTIDQPFFNQETNCGNCLHSFLLWAILRSSLHHRQKDVLALTVIKTLFGILRWYFSLKFSCQLFEALTKKKRSMLITAGLHNRAQGQNFTYLIDTYNVVILLQTKHFSVVVKDLAKRRLCDTLQNSKWMQF